MTIYQLLGVLLRRWYVVLLVLTLTAALGWTFARDGGLSVTRTLVTFDAPDAGPWEEGGSADSGIIVFASAVATEVNGGVAAIAYSSADAPFYGAGIREGVRVAVPDTGGQWGVVYNRAAIAIDVVSSDPAWVAERQRAAVAAVVGAARERQSGIPHRNRIIVAVEPLSETIDHVGPSRTAQVLAGGALGVAGLLVAAWIAAAWDARVGGARDRRGGTVRFRRSGERAYG